MLMLLQMRLSEFQAGMLFGSILGALLGLIPLILGIVKKRTKIGILGFVAAIVGNALFGILLSIPIIVACIYLILKKDTPANVKTDDSENR